MYTHKYIVLLTYLVFKFGSINGAMLSRLNSTNDNNNSFSFFCVLHCLGTINNFC